MGLFAPGNHPRITAFRSGIPSRKKFALAGVTRDVTGAPLGNCTVRLFAAEGIEVGITTSDGSGNYSFPLATNSGTFTAIAVDPTGLLAGATTPTLVAT